MGTDPTVQQSQNRRRTRDRNPNHDVCLEERDSYLIAIAKSSALQPNSIHRAVHFKETRPLLSGLATVRWDGSYAALPCGR